LVETICWYIIFFLPEKICLLWRLIKYSEWQFFMVKIKTILYSALITFVSSCGFETDPENIPMGKDFISSQAWLSLVDSFSVNMSTVILDSVRTSGTGIAWVGSYSDDELGKISASSYFEIGLPLSVNIDEETDRYDSLTLVMKYTSAYYGDTVSSQLLHVYPLAEELDPDDESDFYFNTSSVRLKDNPIGSIMFSPHPKEKDSIQIRLSDNLGRDILEKFKNKDDSISTEERFKEYFRGIALVSGENNTAVLGFHADLTLRMILHTTREGLENEEIENTFEINNTSYQFNRFTADRAGTGLESIGYSEKHSSSKSGDKTYIQSGLGVLTRVDFPTIQRLLEMDQLYDLSKVELILFPEPGTYNEIAPPSQIVLYHTDKYNRIVSEIVDSYGSILAAEYYFDSVYNENTRYVFNIKDFIKTELSDGYFDSEHGLFIGETYTRLGSSLNRVVLSARKGSAFSPQLKLYFLFYNS